MSAITSPRYNQYGSILRQQRLEFQCVLHVQCLQCKECNDWVNSLSDMDNCVVEIIKRRREDFGDTVMDEAEVRCDTFDRLCDL